MSWIKKIAVFALVFLGNGSTFGEAYASTQKYFLDENQRIKGHISSSEPNRIKIEGDRITEVIGLDDNFALESDSRLGQIFIKATGDKATKALFTIVTEKGKTQDLGLVVKKKEDGQTILLRNKDIEFTGKIIGNKHARHDEIVSLIKSGRRLSSDTELKQKLYRENNLEITLLTLKKFGRYSLEIFKIENKDDQVVSLKEQQFLPVGKESNIAAIMIEQRELNPNEVTKLYKVRYDG